MATSIAQWKPGRAIVPLIPPPYGGNGEFVNPDSLGSDPRATSVAKRLTQMLHHGVNFFA